MSALTDTFTAIANAIRGKLGVQTTYTPTQMSSAIASIPTAKEEQTKSVTATTSQQTVTPDTGKVLSSVTVNPQVHSATYTPTGYSNANDMGAQNNYRYVDTSAYEPTSITPSNSSPATITSGEIYQATENGKAVASVTSITPSNSSPVSLSSGTIYKPSSSGYAISSYSSKTPSDTSPAAISSGSITRASSAGYLYKTQNPHFAFMTPDKVYQADMSSTQASSISVTQKPRYIIYTLARYGNNSGQFFTAMIDTSNTSTIYRMTYTASGGYAYGTDTYSTYIQNVSSSTVTVKNPWSYTVRGTVAIYY